MCNCVICGKKLRAFKTTKDWKGRDIHLNCHPQKKKKARKKLKDYIEQFKLMCNDKTWDYDYETNKIIDKRI